MLPLALRLCKGVTHLTCALLSGSYNTSMMGPLITDRSINQSISVCVCVSLRPLTGLESAVKSFSLVLFPVDDDDDVWFWCH